ncbi:chymotrypsin-like elastase family member 2A [Maniola jurtina]|uniref:chymotrypsin-like elastase family member 2A n=1 Tax=Maniola jurtina TaxID=191418 RepID=UPI001E68BE3B|nr:chymotrypsin-like elastase family member 2A [Maniola jurtina]
MMKRIVVILYGVFMVVESKNRVRTPLDTLPLTSACPCKDSQDVSIWFELGVPLKDLNQYYVHINKTFPTDSVMKVSFDTEVKITFTVRSNENKFSRVSLKKSDNFTVRFFTQLVGLSFIVKWTTPGLVPHLTGLAIDDEEFCVDPDVESLEKYTAERMPQGAKYPWYAEGQRPKNIDCGQRKVGHTDPAVNGETKPGDWPWHVALYRRKYNKLNYDYICGGTLISESFVLTVAHCVSVRGIPFPPEKLIVWLGKYHLYVTDKQSEIKDVERVVINEEYDSRRLSNDIALLKLKSQVQFTDYIQPACLAHAVAHDSTPYNTNILGNIVGWGYDNDNQQASTLQQAVFPTVSAETCLRSYPDYYAMFTSWKTFCAGYRNNGTSACNGDSGGGYQVFVPNKEQDANGTASGAWHVTGIISNMPAMAGVVVCDSDYYTVFTDVAKFRDWIDSYLDD